MLKDGLDSLKELIRLLLKKLVGPENLKRMCARGNSKKTETIPEDIMSAIECK